MSLETHCEGQAEVPSNDEVDEDDKANDDEDLPAVLLLPDLEPEPDERLVRADLIDGVGRRVRSGAAQMARQAGRASASGGQMVL
jgi:hypothetical protein